MNAALQYIHPSTIVRRQSIAIRPPRRQTVVDTMREIVRFRGPGGVYELWSPELTPYMIRPAELLTSRRVDGQVVVGPARSGKTAIIDGWIAHALAVEPADFCLVSMTQLKAREYSITRLKRMINNSREVKASLSPLPRDDNIFDKFGAAGQVIKVAWPSVSQLSSSEYRWVAATDVDRMSDDIDGEGDVFGLLGKRTTTYLSAANQYYESSPGRTLEVPGWKPKTPHEGPPVGGIVGQYNRCSRSMWYWLCQGCGHPIRVSPDLDLFRVPGADELKDDIEALDIEKYTRGAARIGCPDCGNEHQQKDRRALNMAGRWVPDGCTLNERGDLEGPTPATRWESYWLGGAAAAYQSWESLISSYLHAVRHWARTGEEELLKRTITQDQGGVFLSPTMKSRKATVDDLRERLEVWTERTVPAGVRGLIASVDVQKDRFVVQVHGYAPGWERWIVDRYNIRRSDRRNDAGQPLDVDPAAYAEDWNLLKPLIIKSYPLSDGSGRRMRLALTLCDMGGKKGVTPNAVQFARQCQTSPEHRRFMLVRGANRESAPRWQVRYPDTSGRSDRQGATTGDVPVLFANSTPLKDALAAAMTRKDPGPGFLHIPNWAGEWLLTELTREQRSKKGWSEASGNEGWDLLYYAEAAAGFLGMEKAASEDRCPAWLRPADRNPLVIHEGEDRRSTAAPRKPGKRQLSRGIE